MNAEQAKMLREPFPPEMVGKLPRLNCKDCSNAKPQGHCDRHKKTRCAECQNYISEAHIHLDYVGHAAVTDRLIKVDPDWTWEPMAYGPNGEPLVTNGGLWIWLTVADVRRPGFGDASSGGGAKELIGDAIRNAAMRFGVALDLWAKQDLNDSAEAKAESTPAEEMPEPAAKAAKGPKITKAQLEEIGSGAALLASFSALTEQQFTRGLEQSYGVSVATALTKEQADDLIQRLKKKMDELPGDAEQDDESQFHIPEGATA